MSNDLASMMEEDFNESVTSTVEKVDQQGLKTVASLARAIREKEEAVDALETKLKEEKRALLRLTDEEMPAMLAELGVTSFTFEDGSSVEVRQTYGASIKVENREQAYEWLRDNGYDDIVKNTVFCSFGRGEDEDASKFARFVADQGFTPEQKTEIHPSTLRAFIKERVESGDEFPMDLFGAWIGQRATIKKGK